ncbi:hypothetical protein ACSSS7_006240 [Eimeria intestinalis]
MREQPGAVRSSGLQHTNRRRKGPQLQALRFSLKLVAAESKRPLATTAEGHLELLSRRKLLSVSGADAAPLLQSLVSQDLLHFAPLLESPAIAALGPSGRLTRLQVKNTKKSAEEAAALGFPEPPRSFTINSGSSRGNLLQGIRLHRRPAIAAAFLNPKGRVLADTFILWRDNVAGSPRFLLDVDASVAERVLVYLERHAVSSSFSVSFEERFAVLQLLPSIQKALSLQATPPPPVASSQGPDFPEVLKDEMLRQSFTFVRCSADGPLSFRLLDALGLPPIGAAPAGAAPDSAADGPGLIEGFVAADRRTWRLGYRVYLGPVEEPHEGLSLETPSQRQSASAPIAAKGNSVSATARSATAWAGATAAEFGGAVEQRQRPVYETYRRLSGVCEGSLEAGVGEQLPLSLNFDFLGLTCSHNKGCFVGQEVLTRALHQLSSRRRVGVLLKKPLCLSNDLNSRSSKALSPASGRLREKNPFEAWVPSEVLALWESALEAAASRLLESCSVEPPGSAETEQDSTKERVVAGDRLYRQTAAAAGEAGAWREIGHVLAFDEDVACGLCLLRSPPTDGPLKSTQWLPLQDLATFLAALAGVRLMVCKEKPPKGLVEEPEPEDVEDGFLVVPPPYVVDALLAAPEAAASS